MAEFALKTNFRGRENYSVMCTKSTVFVHGLLVESESRFLYIGHLFYFVHLFSAIYL